jgi:outer membrane protein OmpA-like peptidoglycan-associated protein
MCVFAQENFRTQLFREVDYARLRAKERSADVLTPKTFAEGMEAYGDAKELFQRGRPLDEIQARIRTATRLFNASVEAVHNAENVFATVIEARTDAMTAEAPRVCPDLWNRAETVFRNATTELQEGNAGSARADGGEAQGMYRMAELEAIKTSSLTRTRELLKRADAMRVETTAPQTLERARKFLRLAETMIQQNRYDNTEARRLAEEASYEAAHAIYLHQMISQMQSEGRGLEEALLQFEGKLGKIAAATNVPERFDAGPDVTIHHIIAAIQSKDSTIHELAQSNKLLRAQNEPARRRATGTEFTGSGDTDLSRGMDARKRHDQTIALASSMFTAEDGVILRDGNNVILRVYGFDFAPGRSALEGRFSGLLSKVQRIVRLFPNCQITVEGHTERGTNESANQSLSEARAQAVASYLRNALPPSTPVVAQGNGSTYPVSDNATPEGRARNRRIDVVIIPEWAIVGR